MDKNLGSLEQMLMLVTARLASGAHGLAIRKELERIAGRNVSPGAIYTTMDRLAEYGLVDGEIGAETPETGGRQRKFYRLTPEGARVLERTLAKLQRLSHGLRPQLAKLARDVD